MFERSKPARYMFLNIISKNESWDPSASPVPSDFSVTILPGSLKGSVPQHGWEQSARQPCAFCVRGFSRLLSFPAKGVCVPSSLFMFFVIVCGPYFLCVSGQHYYCQMACIEPCEGIVNQRALALEGQASFRCVSLLLQ